ncbi:nuclear pore complex protein NUP96 isoform X2 [Morus notabilis]|uniref:nuclear pore complex protein NUP96 isoform X2 n=1 Tax=Morus notabilis TaxID=981085 RepID=UPI000CED7499|nr:nuclear pore complex protein NUP96 isoform X2 [Morus notabilis]
MASPLLPVSVECMRSDISVGSTCAMDFAAEISNPEWKKRRIILNENSSSSEILREIEASLPTLHKPEYYMEPCFDELVQRELMDPGYCSRVPDLTIGRYGYGSVKYVGETDVRLLDVDAIVTFGRHEIVVYEDESAKPLVGQGLNKTAEVTLVLRLTSANVKEGRKEIIEEKLRRSTDRQGAQFISFDPENGEWKFLAHHFSRFGLSEDDEEDITMDDATPAAQEPVDMNGDEVLDVDEEAELDHSGGLLSHSLPAHLGLDPVKMNEMRMLMFRDEEEDMEDFNHTHARQKPSFGKDSAWPFLQNLTPMNHRSSPPIVRKTPLALLEYKHGSFDSNTPGTILLAQQNKTTPLKKLKTEGFKLDLMHETPVTGSHSRCLVDAGLFMGRSFGVAWGPNGTLIHAGKPVGGSDSQKVLSSVINLEKVAIDKVVRDENNKVKKELVDFSFHSLLSLHKEINHETKEFEFGSFKLKLQKLVSNRLHLSEICRSYADIIQKQLEVTGLSSSARSGLMHQIMVWELIRVLFSDREKSGQLKTSEADNEEDMMQDVKEASPEADPEALPLIRRAEFSYWLQESVCGRVQDDISSLNETSYLQHIFLLLTGRQLDSAAELAVSKSDVRLACLLSQAGGSMVNRSDVAKQLDLWKVNGLDFSFIEKDRIRLYNLLAGNIHGALYDLEIDWKRFLGLLMWYKLPPQASLPTVFRTYQNLLGDGRAPCPVPVYVDEEFEQEALNWRTKERYDISYYLMLLHASEESESGFLQNMFSAFSSTHDPLDYHMIWHQRAVLEGIGAISSDDLHVLDMGLVSQLLCLGQCHWAIYVVLHTSYREDFPYLQANLIREILFQYCESWSSEESQRQFIENLGVPVEWLHEALAIYHIYVRNHSKALEHFLECAHWQKAHTIFITSVAHTLFLSGKHSEIWKLATSMEDHKSEIDNWDLGTGIYVSFYFLRSSLLEDNDTMTELDFLESKNDACRNFISQLNESLAVWGGRLPVEARVAYSKMAEEMSSLLLSDLGEGSTRDVQLSCFDTVSNAPIPDELRSSHLQEAVSLFTCYLSEVAT